MTSARGWQPIQLAALGFIGLCGAIWAGGDLVAPDWAGWLAAVLAVIAFGLACLGTFLVGRVANPLRPGPEPPPGSAARQVRLGVRMTYLAVTLVVAATLSAWWPDGASAAAVAVRAVDGQTWCGELVAGPEGAIRLDTAAGTVSIPTAAVHTIQPIPTCP